jgi:VanZ like family
VPLRLPGEDWAAIFFRLRFLQEFDLWLNAIAYVPMGALACLYFRRAHPTRVAVIRATAFATAFSLTMELCQFFIPFRVANVADVVANGLGGAIGACAFLEPIHTIFTQPIGNARERIVIAGGWGDAGLMLVTLWLLAQLNPALPFFEAGDIGENAPSFVPGLVTSAAVALSVCGFGLFISALLNQHAGTLRATLLLLTLALWLKFVMSSIMLKPHLSDDWLSEARMLGLAAGLVFFFPLRLLGRKARIYAAILFLLAGALLAKIFGAYSTLGDFLRLFSWPYGQLATFATLTRTLHETWPALAIGFLIALFIWRRDEPVR